jgi:alpha-amylase/alpha-mannosidase (GH57 family)
MMKDTHFYFQVHQPFRLKEYNFSMIGEEHEYEEKNAVLLDHLADKYYLPTNKHILRLIKKHKGKLKVIFSMSGCAMEQFMLYRPDVLVSFQKLAQTGKVEFLAQTYYHSLSFLYSPKEFERQVKKHHDKITTLFGKQPITLGNEKRDWSAYLGNSMQKEAINRIYSLEEKVLESKSESLIETWGRLQTSDYFYYMSTKVQSNNENIQKPHSPYSSPFDAYINYMNIISDFENLLMITQVA